METTVVYWGSIGIMEQTERGTCLDWVGVGGSRRKDQRAVCSKESASIFLNPKKL